METSIITNQRLDRIDAQPVMARNMTSKALGVTLAFMVILLAMFTPRVAEAGPSDLDAAIRITFPTSAVANLCGNCHTDWVGLNPSYSSRIDYYIYNVLAPSPIPTTNTMYAMDSDQDGRTNLEEIQASTLAARPAQFPTGVSTGPNVANNWNWQIPDVDGDGAIDMNDWTVTGPAGWDTLHWTGPTPDGFVWEKGRAGYLPGTYTLSGTVNGQKVQMQVVHDPSLLGGLVVKIGARLYDTSLKSRLQRLQYAMKGAA